MPEAREMRPHVDHVGSLVRPAAVLDAFDAVEDGRITPPQFRTVADDAIRDAVALQESIGLSYITDGEFRRRSYVRGIIAAVEGFEQRPTPFTFRSPDGREVPVNAGYATGRLKRRGTIVAEDFTFLQSVTRNVAKTTMPSPDYFHFGLFADCFDKSAYGSADEVIADILALYRAEIADLARAGCTLLQLDDTALPFLCDPHNQEIVRSRGQDPAALLTRYIGLINQVADWATAAGMRVRVHLCRGNRVGMWAAAGGYDPIAEELFGSLRVDGLLMEFDSERAGGFEPLRFLPNGLTVYLGIVSTKAPAVEPGDQIIRRIEDASRFAPVERLGLCPQCGFGASALRKFASENPMTLEIETRKLERLVEVADRVWGTA